jgi:hypothetical protein
VVALHGQVEICEVKLTAAVRSISPGVEVSAVGQVVVNEPGEDASDERVAIAIALEIALDVGRGAGDSATSKQGFGVGWTEPGETLAEDAGDRLIRLV